MNNNKQYPIDNQWLLRRRTVCKAALGMAAASIWAPLSGCSGASLPDTVVETTYGKVRGTTEGPIKVFKGIPYGADTALTRFQRAKPPAPWSGERNALQYGKQTAQLSSRTSGSTALLKSWAIPQETGEDCLVVNVWTPGVRDNKKRPVMLWIHGGGFSYGSAAATAYEGGHLAERGDVVVVSLNHRLNIFGFLYLKELGGEQYADSGNVGQLDIIDALKWIRDNISEFGGDPNNVTVFGESGGGMKICTLLAMPEAKGLFHRAVAESGQMVWGADPGEATEAAQVSLKMLNISTDNLSALNDLSMEQILEVYRTLPPATSVKLAPVVDGVNLPHHPFDPSAPTVSTDVPLLIGLCRTETTFVFSSPPFFELNWEALSTSLQRYCGSEDVNQIVARFRQLQPEWTPSDIFFAATTHIMMTRNVITIADRKAAQNAAPVYRYELDWPTPLEGGKWRSPHTLEIPLVFDNVAKSESLFGGSPPEAQQMADIMSEAWIAFARNGNPGTSALPQWPAYTPEQHQTMMFNLNSRVATNPRRAEVDIVANAPAWNPTRAMF